MFTVQAMNQLNLPRPRSSLVERLAAYFRERPSRWIDGAELASIAGRYAWRTRASDLRRPPFNMRILNRQRHLRTDDGRTITISEYRFDPGVTAQEGAAGDAGTSPAAV